MWITALSLGLLGSLHCAGMCSPLMVAATTFRPKVFVGRLVYNGGRIFIYSVLGAFIAGTGFGLSFARLQNVVAITLGITLLVVGLFGSGVVNLPGFVQSPLQKFSYLLKTKFALFTRTAGLHYTFATGMLNGILPCGLSLIALSFCLTLKGPIDGFNFMALFGLGTLPAMLGAGWMFQSMTRKLSVSSAQLTSIALVVSGILIIARIFVQHPMAHHDLGQHMADVILCR